MIVIYRARFNLSAHSPSAQKPPSRCLPGAYAGRLWRRVRYNKGMPSLENIAGVVGGAGARHIVVEAGRCVEVRHRMARCSKCVDTCPEEAITVRENRITIQPELCIGCGSCASTCPTQALRTTAPSREDLITFVDTVAEQVFAAIDEDGGETGTSLEFACEHATPGNCAARIVVPALPYVDESVLMHAAAMGFQSIALTSCNQGSCMKPTLAAMPDVLQAARALLAATGTDCAISLRRQKPRPEGEDGKGKAAQRGARRGGTRPAGQAQPIGPTTVGSREYSRRGMLSDMANQATTIVAETAALELRDRLGVQEQEASLRQTLTDGRGNMLKFAMPRAESLLDDLYMLNPEPEGTLSVRGFTRPGVNAAACTRCSMCARFCPTGALECDEAPIGSMINGSWSHFDDPWNSNRNSVPEGSLTFRISDCVGCRLCETACPLRCLKVCDEIDASTIFELEPMDLLAPKAEA